MGGIFEHKSTRLHSLPRESCNDHLGWPFHVVVEGLECPKQIVFTKALKKSHGKHASIALWTHSYEEQCWLVESVLLSILLRTQVGSQQHHFSMLGKIRSPLFSDEEQSTNVFTFSELFVSITLAVAEELSKFFKISDSFLQNIILSLVKLIRNLRICDVFVVLIFKELHNFSWFGG